jgi:hypothetical protein
MVDKLNAMSRITRWNLELVGTVVSRLKELNAFDNTVCMYMNSMSNPAMHNNENLPVVLLAGAQTQLRTGRHLRLPESGSRYVNDLHAALLAAFGGTPTTFGDPELFGGPLLEVLA